mmetsp:Transcript_3735/g.7539  ORF Transcript_3735/g.7539 Transcript_3735/m.7539 type:complete len:1023 (+) Transcript_3735:27-3095(+)
MSFTNNMRKTLTKIQGSFMNRGPTNQRKNRDEDEAALPSSERASISEALPSRLRTMVGQHTQNNWDAPVGRPEAFRRLPKGKIKSEMDFTRPADRRTLVPDRSVQRKISKQMSLRGHHDLHERVLNDDPTVRKIREQQGRRRSSIVQAVIDQFAVIEDDMNWVTLKFNDPQIEDKFESFTRRSRFEHMRYGTYIFTAFIALCQILFALSPVRAESGLPTIDGGRFWYFIILMLVACGALTVLSYHPDEHRRIGGCLNIFFYTVGFSFMIYLFWLVDDLEEKINKGEIESIQDILGGSSVVYSLTYAIIDFKDVQDGAQQHYNTTDQIEILSEVGRVALNWQLASSCGLIQVTAIMVLDAITMATFLWSMVMSMGVAIGMGVVFGTSGGPTTVMVVAILSVHIFNMRFTERTNRHEFIIHNKRMDDIYQEEEKLKRKSEALEARLKLSVEQLKMIEQAEDQFVGDKIAELSAWKVDVDTEVLFDRKVAAGSFGIVYLAKMRATKRNVAVKQLLSDQVNPENMERFFSEILLHSKLHHPHLVEMIGASWEAPNLCLILAYCQGGDLKGLLETEWDVLAWPSHKLRMVKEISQAIAYLHSQKIMHRDLKTANVLVDGNLRMKVSDFGESRVLKKTDHNLTMVGTNFYIAPEIFRGDNDYDFKADVFSLGMIMLAMTISKGSLRNFFVDEMGMKVKINANYASIRMSEGWRPDFLNHDGKLSGKLDLSNNAKLSDALSKFIETLISPSPDERPDLTDIVKSLDNLERWICVNPPAWAAALDKRIILGTTVCHPERGVGSIVSFDGFERVHVLYEEGNNLYRRYSEEGWKAKMSIGKDVINPNASVGNITSGILSAGRRLSLSHQNDNKVGAQQVAPIPGESTSSLHDLPQETSSELQVTKDIELIPGLSASQSLGAAGIYEIDPRLMTPEQRFEDKRSISRRGDNGMHDTSPVPGDDRFLRSENREAIATKDEDGMGTTDVPSRKKRRRSSLMRLAEDGYDPREAIANALKNAEIAGRRRSLEEAK